MSADEKPRSMTGNDLIDYVFLDEIGRPFRITNWGEDVWIFYWHPDQKWVSLRKATQQDIWDTQRRSLPPEEAKLYNDKSERDQRR
jgi:hypothetical protein